MRAHRQLSIEELEQRIAPAFILSAAHPVLKFLDADGDFVLLRFSGPGLAVIQGANGGANIENITFSGTTEKTGFLMKDLNPTGGDNTLTAGSMSVTTGLGESLGSFQVIVPKGRFVDTTFAIHGNLGKFQVNGDSELVRLGVFGDLKTANLLGDIFDSNVDAGGTLGTVKVKGDAVESSIGAGGDVAQVNVNGFLVDSSVFIGQSASSVRVGGSMLGSDIIANGSIDRVFIGGEMLGAGGVGAFGDPPEIEDGISVGVHLGSVIIKGDVEYADIAAGESAGRIQIGGYLAYGSIIIGEDAPVFRKGGFDEVPLPSGMGTGDLGTLIVMDGIAFANVDIAGNADMIKVDGMAFSNFDVDGNVNQFQITGPQFLNDTWIDGNANNVQMKGLMELSSFGVNGNVNKLTATDAIIGGEGIYIGGNLAQGALKGGMESSRMLVDGNVSKLMIKNGLQDWSSLCVEGHTDFLQIHGGILGGSWVDLQQTADTVQVFGDIEPTQGPPLNIEGRLLGSMSIRGNVSGTIRIDDGSRYAPIKIIGDLTGELYTNDAFGDVSILGNFTGLIGAEGPGVGNTLRVTGPDASGDVNPYPEAFNHYIGYDGPPPP